MNVLFRKRCMHCHAFLDAAPLELLPKVIGRPELHCKRCGQATKLSLTVALASSAAGSVIGMLSVAVCDHAIAGSTHGPPIGSMALLVPLGLVTWLVGYLAFAVACYGIQRGLILLRGMD